MPLRATAILAAPVIALALAPAPADASRAVNPYTPAEACANDFDGTWVGVSDNKRDLIAPNGEKWGEVYLMWNDTTKYNCVATIKTKFVGTRTTTEAYLFIEGESRWRVDPGDYEYYAAVQGRACDKRVKFKGTVYRTADDTTNPATGGRDSFGNGGC